MCNPNLLINTDFRNPVNQRGQSEYTGTGYCIDMWKIYFADCSVSLESDSILLKQDRERQARIMQIVENAGALSGKICTFSVLAKGDGTNTPKISVQNGNEDLFLYAATQADEYELITKTFTVPNDITELRIIIYASTNNTIPAKIYIKSAKLELGSFSTLANEVVDYATELRKCQRYLQVYAGEVGSAIKSFGANDEWLSVIPLVAPMRVQPTVLVTTYFMLRNKGNYRVVSVYTYNVWRENSNILSMWLEMNEALDADVADIFVDNNGMLILSAEL